MIAYDVVDMFTDRPFDGSPLAVVPDADGLADATMAAIAAELNTTETAFVLAPSSADATYRVRIFTSAGESPHGGHSSVGTAATLVRLGRVAAGPVVQECGAARQVLDAAPGTATLAGRDPVRGGPIGAVTLLAATGLTVADLGEVPPGTAGFGALFPFLAVRPDSLSRACPDFGLMRAENIGALFLFAWDEVTRIADARLFAPGFGIPEDPACAPLALALGARLAEAGLLPDGEHHFTIRQRTSGGRSGVLRCTASVADRLAVNVTVTGTVVPVAGGRIAV